MTCVGSRGWARGREDPTGDVDRARPRARVTERARDVRGTPVALLGSAMQASHRNVGQFRDFAELRIGETTVKTHLLHIFDKLGVDDRTAAVTVALQRGLLSL